MKYLILLLIFSVIKSQETSFQHPCATACERFCRHPPTSNPITNNNCKPEIPLVRANNPETKTYYVEQERPRNWFGAIQECVKRKGHLAHLESESEYETILEKLEYGKHYWIDINDLNKKDSYYSLTTGFQATYFKWHKNQPDNYDGNERCIELRSQDNLILMNDRNCETFSFFVCEI